MVERIIVGSLFTNAYICSIGKKDCFVIDPGAEGEKIISRLRTLNLTPKGIVLTHGHLDHTAAINDIVQFYSEKEIELKIIIHKKDGQYLGKSSREVNKNSLSFFGMEGDQIFDSLFVDLPAADVYCKEGETLFDTDFTVIYTPGHTEGSISLYSEERNSLFSGDTLFFKGIGRTDMEGGSLDKLMKSIKTKLFELPPETRLFPGHGPFSSIEREIKSNPFVV
jgi:hydroxyacylglutathione hydrolase